MKKVIATTKAPAAIGPYNQAIQVGNMLFASGQLGLDPATGNFPEGGVKEQTIQSFQNVKAILEEAGFSINDVVKTTVFLADMADFAAMNEIYASQFEGDFPARSAVAVKTLPKNALVEVSKIKNLDNFIEIEFLNSDSTVEEQVSKLKSILNEIGIDEKDIETEAYINLLSK